MARYDLWTHGIATILESPEVARLVQHRSDIGTVVEQDAGTSAWFHIPISTPTIIADVSTIRFLGFALVATVNGRARLDAIHVRRGKDLIHAQATSFIGTTINRVFDTPDASTSGSTGNGITLSMHVQFLSGFPRGRVEFHGAGGMFGT